MRRSGFAAEIRSFHPIRYSGADLGFPHMRNTYLNKNFNAPQFLQFGEVLDEVNKNQSAAGAVIHRNFVHGARPLRARG